MDMSSFTHSDTAEANRENKAKSLARFCWDRNINSIELMDFSDAHRRRLARAAGVNPPSTLETWEKAVALMLQKQEWLQRNPGHPAGDRHALDERGEWVPEPEKPVRKRKPKAEAA